MHSRYARNLYDPKIKIIFEIVRADFEIILFIHFYPLKQALGWSQKHFMNKFYKGLFFTTSIIWPKKFQISCKGKKVPFWQFFRKAETHVSWDTFPIWIFILGPFWAVRAAEKKNANCHKYAIFEAIFFMFKPMTSRSEARYANPYTLSILTWGSGKLSR